MELLKPCYYKVSNERFIKYKCCILLIKGPEACWNEYTMKTTIIIPARYASSRYPGKPLVKLKLPTGEKSH